MENWSDRSTQTLNLLLARGWEREQNGEQYIPVKSVILCPEKYFITIGTK
jgi:hypothetical protein